MENETLQAIRQMFAEEREHASKMIDEKLETALKPIKADLSQIKRDTTITRVAVNSLIDWVDSAQEITGIRYPTK